MISDESKQKLLISRNKDALDRQMRILDNTAVDITEDSMYSDILPHANPPFHLSVFDQ